MAKRKTPNQLAWNKEYSRIRNFIKRAEKRGYIFDVDALPTKPSRVTAKQLETIKSLTPGKLYLRASYVKPTGEKVSGVEGRKLERSLAAAKAVETRQQKRTASSSLPKFEDVVISNIQRVLESYIPPQWMSYELSSTKIEYKHFLVKILEDAVRRDGKGVVAARIEKSGSEVSELIDRILNQSQSEQIQIDLFRFSEIISGLDLSSFENESLNEVLVNFYEDTEI